MEKNEVMSTEPTTSYKERMLGRIKGRNPEFASDNEEDMMAELEAIFTETEGAKNEYEGFANQLKDLSLNDPKFAAVIEVMKSGKSFGYAVGKIYGKEFFESEDEDFENGDMEYRTGVDAANADKEKVKANMQSLVDRIIAKDIPEDQKEVVFDKIRDKIERYQYCDVPDSDIEDEVKALNYDGDIEGTKEAALAEGKNAKIDMTLKKPATMPDMGMVSGSGKANYETRRLSPLDKFKEGK